MLLCTSLLLWLVVCVVLFCVLFDLFIYYVRVMLGVFVRVFFLDGCFLCICVWETVVT